MEKKSDTDQIQKLRQEEYEMQLFGCSSGSLKKFLRNEFKKCIDAEFEQLDKTIVKKTNPKDEVGKRDIKKTTETLKNLYIDKFKPFVDKTDDIIDTFVNIPSNILLKEDQVHFFDEESKKLNISQEKMDELSAKAKQAKTFNALLEKELGMLKNVSPTEQLANDLSSIIDTALEFEPITDKTQQTIDKLITLKKSLH